MYILFSCFLQKMLFTQDPWFTHYLPKIKKVISEGLERAGGVVIIDLEIWIIDEYMYTVHFRLLARSFTAIVPYFPTGTMEREEVEGRVATAKVHCLWGGGHTSKKCSYLTAIYCVLPQYLLTFRDRLCDTLQG